MTISPHTILSLSTVALVVAALALLARAILATRRAALAEQQQEAPIGRRYDAIHESVTVTELSGTDSGELTLELAYGAGHIVYLDRNGYPDAVSSIGPGAVRVEAPRTLQARLHRMRRRSHASARVVVTERGVLTDRGRVVEECFLSHGSGPALRARMTAASAFPTD